MEPGATLLIFEHLIPDETGDEGADRPSRAPACALDINMMAVFGGRERSWQDLGSLLATAGFRLLPRRRPLPSDSTLLTARRQ
jgi:hypothetical protein